MEKKIEEERKFWEINLCNDELKLLDLSKMRELFNAREFDWESKWSLEELKKNYLNQVGVDLFKESVDDNEIEEKSLKNTSELNQEEKNLVANEEEKTMR